MHCLKRPLLLLLAISLSLLPASAQEITQLYEGEDTLLVLPSGLSFTQLTAGYSISDKYDLPDGLYRAYVMDSYAEEAEDAEPIEILQFTLKNEVLNGPFEKTNTAGKLLKKGNYLAGKTQGYWYEYPDSLDIPFLKTYYELGVSMEMTFYSPEGFQERRLIYFNETASNKKVLMSWYFPNGFPAMQGVTQVQLEGKKVVNKTGQWKSWYENGNLRSVEYYETDQLTGLCEYYDTKGRITNQTMYKKGKLKKERTFEYDKTEDLPVAGNVATAAR